MQNNDIHTNESHNQIKRLRTDLKQLEVVLRASGQNHAPAAAKVAEIMLAVTRERHHTGAEAALVDECRIIELDVGVPVAHGE